MELSILTVRSIIYLFHCLCTFKSYIPVFAMATSPHSLTPDAQLLPHIFTTSPIAFAVEDLDGTPLYVNPAFCSFLGFSGEELRHKHCVDFSPPEDTEKDWVFFEQLRAGFIDHYQLEKRYFRRDGSLVWGRLSVSSLRNFSVPLILAMVEDITDKKRGEEAVQASEERLRLAQKAARIGTFEWNIQTGVNSWNSQLEELYGLPPGGFGGTQDSFQALLYPADRARVEKLVHTAMRNGQPMKGEWRVVWPDGSIHWIAGRWQVFADDVGKPHRMIGVNVDIDERKHAEQALLELNRVLEANSALLKSREELLCIFVKNVPVGAAMLDREMRYLQVSDRWCADYGLDVLRVLGRSHYEIFPDIPVHWKAAHRRALEKGETLQADEDCWDRENGPTWVRWEIRPWKTSSGAVGGILIFAENITDRKKAEEALADVPRKLIEAHEEERTWIARELHDNINQQLALLSVEFDQWTRQEAGFEENGISVKRRLEEISFEIQNLSHRLHSSKLDYLGLTAAAKGFCEELSTNAGVEVHFHSSALPTAIPTEISLCLFRVLQESLQNAVRHSGARTFQVTLIGKPDTIQLTVSDDGSGFNIQQAFLGTGLGLVSMRERIQIVRGQMEITSTPALGT